MDSDDEAKRVFSCTAEDVYNACAHATQSTTEEASTAQAGSACADTASQADTGVTDARLERQESCLDISKFTRQELEDIARLCEMSDDDDEESEEEEDCIYIDEDDA